MSLIIAKKFSGNYFRVEMSTSILLKHSKNYFHV